MGMVVLGMIVVAGLVVVSLVRRGGDALSIALALWGLLTLFAFAPAGSVLALVLADHQAVGALFCGVGAISGFLSAFLMLTTARRRARAEAAPLGAATGSVLVAHHALILATFGVVPSLERGAPEPGWLALLAVPCGIGAALGVALLRADVPLRIERVH
jgi:hypothetical protein